MESRIINLVGQLSAEAGSQLYLELKSILNRPHLLLFDATKLENIDEIGWQFLKKCQTKITQSESHSAIVGLNQEFISGWRKNDFLTTIPIFTDRGTAKENLALNLSGNSKNEFSSNESSKELQPSFQLKDERSHAYNKLSPRLQNEINPSLYCPHCDSILRNYQMGNNTCPSCKGKYFLHKDYKISSFEKVV